MQNIVCPDYNPNGTPCYYFLEKGFCSSKKWFRCIEYLRRKKPVLSNSAVDNFVRCKFSFYNSWVKGYESTKVNIAPTTGNLFHAYAATFHGNTEHCVEQGNIAIKKYTELLRDPESPEGNMIMQGRIVPYLFQGYKKACKENKIRNLSGRAESPYLYEFDTFTLRARIDLDGPEEIVDYKYVSNPDNYTFFSTRFQASIYLALQQKASKITFRCIRRPQLRQGKNETEIEYLERIRDNVYGRPGFYVKDETYYRSEYKPERRLMEIKRMAKEIAENVDNEDFWWQASSERCLAPFKCDFYERCTSGVWSNQIYRRRSETDYF